MTYRPRPAADPDLERAIAAFDLAAYLRGHGHAVYGDRRELVITCPRCGGKDKLYANATTKLFICFRCPDRFAGGLVRLIATIEDVAYGEVIERLRGNAALRFTLAPSPPPAPLLEAVSLPDNYRPLTDPDVPAERPYWTYLARRRVAADDVLRHHMGWVRFGPCAGRVFVPVVMGGRLWSWVARDITGQQSPKVLTPPGNHQASALFNLDRVRGEVALTEGVFDALRAPDLAVATFGKRCSQAQKLALLAAGVTDLVIAWDADAPLETAQAAWALAPFFTRVRVATLPGKDPSDMDEDDFRACVAAAEPVGAWHRLRGVAQYLAGGTR